MVKTEQEAQSLLSRIERGDDFAEIARRFSLDPSAKATGGDIGYHAKGTLIPEYEAAAFKLTKVGQISPPIKTRLGYHIIKLEGVEPERHALFQEVKDSIKQKMTQEKQGDMVQKYIEDLKKNSRIVINEKVWDEFNKQNALASK